MRGFNSDPFAYPPEILRAGSTQRALNIRIERVGIVVNHDRHLLDYELTEDWKSCHIDRLVEKAIEYIIIEILDKKGVEGSTVLLDC